MNDPNKQMQTDTLTQSVTFKTVKFLFGKLYARYGSKFSSQYPVEMMPVVHEEWLEGLAKLTIQDINRGLSVWSEAWPPNIMEFKKACEPARSGLPPCYQEWGGRSLPAPVNKEVGRKALKNIKEILGC